MPKKLGFLSRYLRRHAVRAGLADTAATVLLGTAAGERQIIIYDSAAGLELHIYIFVTITINIKVNGSGTHMYDMSILFCTRRQKTWPQYQKIKIKISRSTAWNHIFCPFSNFSDEVRLEPGHANCCRFANITRVHQGAHIGPAEYWINGKVLS